MGRYQLVFELAQSYLGPLWAVCTDSDASPTPAMLRLVSLARLDADTRVRLLEAAWQAMEVRCDGVCSVTDVVASDGELGLVSEYAEGLPLRALQGLAGARRKPITTPVALRLLHDVADAATALHAASRDLGHEATPFWGGLSPDSVHVTTSGQALLLDPAVASIASTVPLLGGNPERAAYASPEQLGPEPKSDPRSDVFTLGVIAWELLTNRRLFIGSDKAVAQKVISGKIPRLDEVKRKDDPEIPGPVLAAVMKALERNPGARYQSPAEFRDALATSPVRACEAATVSEYVRNVADGALARLREALKDESTGTRAGASVAKANVAARASAADLTAAVSKSDPFAAKIPIPKPTDKALPAIRIDGPKAIQKLPGTELAKRPGISLPLPGHSSPSAEAEGDKTKERSSPNASAKEDGSGTPFPAGAAEAASKAPAPKRRATMIGIASPLLMERKAKAGATSALHTTSTPAAPSPTADSGAPGKAAAGLPPFLDDTELALPIAGAQPKRPLAAHEDLSSLDRDDEPTGQFTAKDLLQHVEQMERTSDSARRSVSTQKPKEPIPEFPEPPTKPRVIAPGREEIDWLDEPEPKSTESSRSFKVPKGPALPAIDNRAEFPKAEAATSAPDSRHLSSQNTLKPPAPATLPKAALVSTPPPAYYPSQIPPPLIHDPRANLGHSRPPPATRANPKKAGTGKRILLGALLSLFLIGASAAIAVFTLRSRERASDDGTHARGSMVLAAPTLAPTEVPALPQASAAPEVAPSASAGAGEAAPTSPDAGASSAPSAAASAGPPQLKGAAATKPDTIANTATKATAAKATPAKTTAAKANTAKARTTKANTTPRKSKKRFVPNDI